ncbi:MAG: signal peptidase II [Candidatus Caldatribacteriota bacterium]|nr:signal peptidase II [Candidatus Caldatribacteriota bacterium]
MNLKRNYLNIMINRWKRITIIMSLLIGYVSLDQFTKYLAKKILVPGSVISFLGDMVRFQYAENKGIYLSFGSTLPDEIRFWLFTVTVSVLLAFMFLFLIFSKKLSFLPTVALTLILSGGIGNLIDRIFYQGVVIDMINFGIGNLRTGILNLADIAVTLGGGLMIYYLLFNDEINNLPSSVPPMKKTDVTSTDRNQISD